MSNNSGITVDNRSTYLHVVSIPFGVVVFAIGTLNVFWGNDPGFGIFLLLLSFIYFPPLNSILKERIGLRRAGIVKILLGIFILWASLGVGELFDKIGLMTKDFY